jgi:signal peptidase I
MPPEKKPLGVKKSEIREWVESIVVALLLAIVIRAYFIQPFKIPSGSMRMTLIEGDHLFVSKYMYGPILLPEIHTPEFLMPLIKRDIQWPESLTPLTKIRLPGFTKPKRGDVIVFIFPDDRAKDFIKRLIALPGDVVEIKDGKIYINDKVFDDPNIRNTYYYNRGEYGALDTPIRVPEGKYFVLGDNSGSSHDSRYWGFVDEKDLLGKAEFIFWPFNRVRMIK